MHELWLIYLSGTKVDMSKDEDAGPTISITIYNASQFPMKSLSVDIHFVPVQSDCDGTVSFNSVSSNRQLKNVSSPTKSLFDGDSELLPEEKHLEIIAVRTSCLAQYNGNITVSIVSPGTGQKLQAYHKFGLYIIDQVGAVVMECRFLWQTYSDFISSSRKPSIQPVNTHHLATKTP